MDDNLFANIYDRRSIHFQDLACNKTLIILMHFVRAQIFSHPNSPNPKSDLRKEKKMVNRIKQRKDFIIQEF